MSNTGYNLYNSSDAQIDALMSAGILVGADQPEPPQWSPVQSVDAAWVNFYESNGLITIIAKNYFYNSDTGEIRKIRKSDILDIDAAISRFNQLATDLGVLGANVQSDEGIDVDNGSFVKGWQALYCAVVLAFISAFTYGSLISNVSSFASTICLAIAAVVGCINLIKHRGSGPAITISMTLSGIVLYCLALVFLGSVSLSN